MNKKAILFGIVSAVCVTLLASCGTDEKKTVTTDSTAKEELNLSFGAMPAVDSLPVYIAQKEGYFEEEGLNLDLQAFKSPKDRDAALTSGNLDGANTDLIALSTYYQGDVDVKVVSQSIGTFSVLTSDDSVKTLADTAGKKAGYAKNQAPYYFLDEALTSEGMNVDDLEFEEVPPIPARLELAQNKQIDVTVVPEPFRTIGLSNGLHELANSNDLDIQSTVFGFTNESLTENKAAVEAFYRAYNKGVDYVNEHEMDDYYDVLKEKIGFSDEIKDIVVLPEYTHAEQIADSQLENAFTWSASQGILQKDWKKEDVMSSFLVD